jgi:putative phosphonate metabolism protein
MTGQARVAIYYAPAADDPLAYAAARWLGRDAETGASVVQPKVPDIDTVTAEPRLYGFHATLKPPFRLRDGVRWDDLLGAAERLAANTAPFDLPRLFVADLRGFLALRESEPCPPLQTLADDAVARLDAFRAPPDDAELARRRRSRLSAEQDAMLVRWGYPYVFETWFFHMTLTRRLDTDERAVLLPAAQAHFAASLSVPRRVDTLCLFTQREPGAPFVMAERLMLHG